MADAITAHRLVKRYRGVIALDAFDLKVEEGTVMALLGPNGAGKTTVVRILTTLIPPDGGRAEVVGLDVVKDARRLRGEIGASGQYAAVDEDLTGFENLEMVGRLYHLGRRPSRERARELLERFDLTEAADRRVKGYSGGMRRRLDLAGALVARPRVLFLDEPTTGLDPQSRAAMWEVISELVARGGTLLLTTQYLEEADRLADRIAVIDRGRVIAEGTSDQLKERVGGERLELTVSDREGLGSARAVLAPLAVGEVTEDARARRLVVPIRGGSAVLVEAMNRLEASGVRPLEVGLRRPTLDEVFLGLTGHAAAETPGEGAGERPGARR